MRLRSISFFLISFICFNAYADSRPHFVIGKTKVVVLYGDITKLKVDVVVNAANKYLPSSPGGVAGAIWKAAGAEKINAWIEKHVPMKINGVRIDVGNVLLTPSFGLEKNGVKRLIHAVGPNCRSHEPIEQLYMAYKRSLEIAGANELKTIAFPPISTGIFGGGLKDCAQQAVGALKNVLPTSSIQTVYLVYKDASYAECLWQELAAFASKLDNK